MTATVVDPRVHRSTVTEGTLVTEPPRSVSTLARLQESINAKVAPVETTVDLPVECRPGWEFRFSTVHPYEDTMQLSAASQDESLPGGINYMTLGLAFSVELCRGLLIDGEMIVGDDGQPITFASKDLQRMLGVTSATDCVRKALAMPVDDGNGVHWVNDDMAVASYGQTLLVKLQGARPTKR